MQAKLLFTAFLLGSTIASGADFIGTLAKNTNIGSINGSSISLSSIGNIASGDISSIIQGYGQSYLYSYGKSQLDVFGSSVYGEALSAWWGENTSWATGTIERCYVYSPSYQDPTFPNICGLFSNKTINPCDMLPNQLGPYKKKSAEDIWKANLAFKDWCESFTDKVGNKDKTIKETIKKVTIGDDNKEDVVDSHFGTEKEKAKKVAIEAESKKVDTSAPPVQGTVRNSLVNLNGYKTAKGHVAKDFLESVSKNSKELTAETTINKRDVEIPFENLKEYNDAVHHYAQKTYEVEKVIAPAEHIKMAEDKFSAINKTYITSLQSPPSANYITAEEEKIKYIEQYIEDKTNGYRIMAQQWAADRAQEEIKYEMPLKLNDETYYMFQNLNATRGTRDVEQTLELNYKIKRQQYFEAQIMKKWIKIADQKADDLKVALRKVAIASRLFNETQAKLEILQIMGTSSN
jgi:hypothetical protein